MPPQLIEQLFEAGLVVSALPYVLCFVSVRASEVDAAVRVGWKWQSVFSRVPMLIRDGARINLRARPRQIRFGEPERAKVVRIDCQATTAPRITRTVRTCFISNCFA